MNNPSWLRFSFAKYSPLDENKHAEYRTRMRPVLAGLLALVCVSATTSRAEEHRPRHYQATNLVSDVPGLAAVTDPHLVNAWGLARSATSAWWVADNGSGLSTLYNGAGVVQGLVVTVPNVPGATDPSAPTGIVFNGTAADFEVAPNTPARFIFATEEGTIAAWNSGLNAVLKVNLSSSAVYKGLALGKINGANFLYAANFAGGTVDVFDRLYAPVTLPANAFQDDQLPKDFAPFNVQGIGDSIYVTFAKKEAGSIDEVHGPGKGFVDVFSTSGVLQKRLRWGSWFNAPWGVVQAPADFGGFGGLILVGQFGSGKIAAFDPDTGEFRGLMRGEHGRSLIIEGLWALSFGNNGGAGLSNVLYFTAGIDDEAHGLFGTITPLAGQPDDAQGEDDGTD